MEWISAQDHLPDEGTYFLVYCNKFLCHEIAAYRTYKNKSGFISGSYQYDDVTHWMPLPEPPKEKTGVCT